MNAKDIRIVFMGTPEFAVPSLKALVEGGYNVVGVVTMPDKPAGRGMKLQESDVKRAAKELGIETILQPEKLRDEAFLEALKSLQPDLGIVIAFRMLPEVVWAMPRFGTFNLHASLLPEYRGAAPINWAIINGDKVSGVTTFFLKHEIDTGDVIMQREVEITDTDDAGTLHDKLMMVGGETVVDTVRSIVRGEAVARTQASMYDGELRPAPKIFRDTCRIDWSKNSEQLYDFVRGLSPYPAAWMEVTDANGAATAIKVYETKREQCAVTHPVGALLTDGKSYVKVALADGYLHLTSLQLPGKKRMPVADLLRGFSFDGYTILQ